MWEVLLPMTEDCLALAKKDLQYSKSRIQRLEMYSDQSFWSAQFYPGPAGWHLLNAIWNHLKINPDRKMQEWHNDGQQGLRYPPPQRDGYDDRRVSVIVSGWKLACWHCGESGHLSAPPKTKMDIMKQIDSLPTSEMNKTERNKNQDGTIFFSGWKSEDWKVVTKKKEKAIAPSNPAGDLLLMNQQNLMQR